MPQQESHWSEQPKSSLWSTTQAYRYSGISPRRLRRLAKEGRIKHKLEGRRPKFTKEWLDEYLRTPDQPA